jgi:hypothetical protein
MTLFLSVSTSVLEPELSLLASRRMFALLFVELCQKIVISIKYWPGRNQNLFYPTNYSIRVKDTALRQDEVWKCVKWRDMMFGARGSFE